MGTSAIYSRREIERQINRHREKEKRDRKRATAVLYERALPLEVTFKRTDFLILSYVIVAILLSCTDILNAPSIRYVMVISVYTFACDKYLLSASKSNAAKRSIADGK